MEPSLQVEDLIKRYPGFTLDIPRLRLEPGYITGLIGPNGAGKTTLIRLVLGLALPDSGSIRFQGMDLEHHGARIRSRIGFVPDRPAYPRFMTGEQIGAAYGPFHPGWDKARFHAVAGDFDLPLDRRFGALSQGNRTRLALALALAHDADLLLLDEPSSGLDPAFRREMLDRLAGFIEDERRAVLFSSHITSDLDRVADHITFLKEGRILLSRTREEILDAFVLVKGDPLLLTNRARNLCRGLVLGEFGFTALTDDLPAFKKAMPDNSLVVEQASLEDLVYYTGRTGRGGLDFHG